MIASVYPPPMNVPERNHWPGNGHILDLIAPVKIDKLENSGGGGGGGGGPEPIDVYMFQQPSCIDADLDVSDTASSVQTPKSTKVDENSGTKQALPTQQLAKIMHHIYNILNIYIYSLRFHPFHEHLHNFISSTNLPLAS